MQIFGLLALGPFLALLGAAFTATVLFWPAMLFIGALHSFIPVIPALGWQATWLLIAVLHLILPSASTSSN